MPHAPVWRAAGILYYPDLKQFVLPVSGLFVAHGLNRSNGASSSDFGQTKEDDPMKQFDGTTILSVRRGNQVALGGNARKVRRLYNDKVMAGFAGGTADAFTLFERFEGKLEKHSGQLVRAAVEMAKDWRTDRYLRRLEALLLVADSEASLMISGNGDVMEPEPHGVMGIGSGGSFATAAARALVENTELSAKEIVEKALNVAADICIYTNHSLTIEHIDLS